MSEILKEQNNNSEFNLELKPLDSVIESIIKIVKGNYSNDKLFIMENNSILENIDKNISGELSDKNIKEIKIFFNTFLDNFYKKIEKNKDNIIGEKFFLYFLIKDELAEVNKNGLIKFDEDFNVEYDISQEKMQEFLSLSKSLLKLLDQIYSDKKGGEELRQSLIKDVDYYVKPFIEGICNKIKN